MPRTRPLRVVLVLGVVLVVWIGAVLVPVLAWWQADPQAATRSQGLNALWLAHRWVGEAHGDEAYAQLAADLRAGEVSDALFHAGPLAADGTVPPERLTHVEALLDAMARHAPEVRTQAYLGQVEALGGGPLVLDDPAVREGVAATAAGMVALGFDGVHYDIEPIRDGNAAFLDLLARTRAALGPDAVLSVSLEELSPPAPVRLLFRSLPVRGPREFGSPGWYRDVAGEVDQIMVMTYGTPLVLDFLAGRYMAWQTAETVRVVDGRADVLMGISSEDEPLRPGEQVCSGVRGVRRGLEEAGAAGRDDVGVAVFAAWTTTPAEWDAYRRLWVEGEPGPVPGCTDRPPSWAEGLG